MNVYEVIIIGGGASGLMAASSALSRNKKVAIIDMGENLARKVSISGGGKCNFTNGTADYKKYFGKNAKFTQSVLNHTQPKDLLAWMKNHGLNWAEKKPGQYFCATCANDVVKALLRDVKKARIFNNELVTDVYKRNNEFVIETTKNTFTTKSVIIATGGISYASLGVSDLGYKTAKKFGHKIIPIRPALCAISTKIFPTELSGISFDVEISIGKEKFLDSMLITHFGLGGPAIYRATVRDIEQDIHLNILPNINIFEWLKNLKTIDGKKSLLKILATKLPIRLSKWLIQNESKNIADYKDIELKNISNRLSNIIIKKDNFKLYSLQTAEVVRGGVSTDEISSKTLESKLCPGLFFAGEVLDITGDLGGFNLHWAFASGILAGENA